MSSEKRRRQGSWVKGYKVPFPRQFFRTACSFSPTGKDRGAYVTWLIYIVATPRGEVVGRRPRQMESILACLFSYHFLEMGGPLGRTSPREIKLPRQFHVETFHKSGSNVDLDQLRNLRLFRA